MAFIDIFNFKKYFSKPSDSQVARYGHVNALYEALQQPTEKVFIARIGATLNGDPFIITEYKNTTGEVFTFKNLYLIDPVTYAAGDYMIEKDTPFKAADIISFSSQAGTILVYQTVPSYLPIIGGNALFTTYSEVTATTPVVFGTKSDAMLNSVILQIYVA